jgi:hypothetical protein
MRLADYRYARQGPGASEWGFEVYLRCGVYRCLLAFSVGVIGWLVWSTAARSATWYQLDLAGRHEETRWLPSNARIATNPPKPRSTGHAVSCHAGKVEGDGEYTDGAVIWVRGITCERALGLVKPRYSAIKLMAVGTHFKLGTFGCRITYPGGPNTVKVCSHDKRGFRFL